MDLNLAPIISHSKYDTLVNESVSEILSSKMHTLASFLIIKYGAEQIEN